MPVKRITALASAVLKPDGSLRLGVVADTHSAPHAAGLEHLAALKPDLLLHAGDIGDLAVLDRLRELAPLHAVRGNIDVRANELPDVIVLEVADATQRVALRLLLLHIAVNGPHLRADIGRLAKAKQARLVVCGHSHVPFMGQEHGVTVFNPGSLGPKRFSLPILFGCIDIQPKGISLRHYDALTGQPWAPN